MRTSTLTRAAVTGAVLSGVLATGGLYATGRAGKTGERTGTLAHTLVLADERAASPWGAPMTEVPVFEPAHPPTPGLFAPPAELFPQERECTGGAPDRFYEFYFTRARYNEGGGFGGGFGGRRGRGGGGSWAVDYPKADCQFITVVKRLAGLDIYFDSNAIYLDDPNLRRFPFLYMLEVGRGGGIDLSDAEVKGLRSYLEAGGFLVIDDFWGTQEWNNFERGFTRVFPDRPMVEIPMDHDVFKVFYTIDKILQVPNEGNARQVAYGFPGARTYEQDGVVPHVFGIFDDTGRLMVIINWNTDLGDAWEWAEQPDYPLEFSTYAFEMGVNMILYSMTH